MRFSLNLNRERDCDAGTAADEKVSKKEFSKIARHILQTIELGKQLKRECLSYNYNK